MTNLPVTNLTDLNLLDLGNTIQFAGIIFAGNDTHYLAYLPGEGQEEVEHKMLTLDSGDWEKVVRQTDQLETEILAQAEDGTLCKVLLRKSTRQIEQGVSWVVYKRDDYKCRYCGIDGVPMTVDHMVLWEHGGPSIADNLLTACRKCNKTRGNMLYKDWLESKYYQERSKGISDLVKTMNKTMLLTIPEIPIRLQKRSR